MSWPELAGAAVAAALTVAYLVLCVWLALKGRNASRRSRER
jgi:hypothetical protein